MEARGGNGDAGGVPMLEMRNVSETFPGVKAFNGAQLRAWGGEASAPTGEIRGLQADADEDPFGRRDRPRAARRSAVSDPTARS